MRCAAVQQECQVFTRACPTGSGTRRGGRTLDTFATTSRPKSPTEGPHSLVSPLLLAVREADRERRAWVGWNGTWRLAAARCPIELRGRSGQWDNSSASRAVRVRDLLQSGFPL